jgi:hypothetical protein
MNRSLEPAALKENEDVELTAKPSLNGIKTVTVAFATIQSPVLIYGDQGYSSVLLAVGALTSNGTIMAKTSYNNAASETLTFDQGLTITLDGGWDDVWATAGGMTGIKGAVSVRDGRLNLKGVRLHP